MDTDIVIDVQNLSKAYKLYNKPIDRLKETLHPLKRVYHRDFYALRDVSFQVKRGETIGIIGKNGAGKSTLLKLITGVLTPSSGSVTVNGKIASLLELGAGFNPEFTGIENIYLHGTIMGYTRTEIDLMLPTILDFADIADFIYQPVKVYSSGMYVRLAFSVAINVEPDVLIVDEALSVGDAKFQLKCLKKMQDLKERGVSILLVTHAIDILKAFADTAILINDGRVLQQGLPVDVGLEYYRLLFGDNRTTVSESCSENIAAPEGGKNSNEETICSTGSYVYKIFPNDEKKYGQQGVQISSIEIHGLEEPNVFISGQHISIKICYAVNTEILIQLIEDNGLDNNLLFGIRMENSNGIILTDIATATQPGFKLVCEKNMGKIELCYNIHMPYLASGEYWFSPGVAVGQQDALVAVLEYVYLFSLRCVAPTRVLGALKFDFSIIHERNDK